MYNQYITAYCISRAQLAYNVVVAIYLLDPACLECTSKYPFLRRCIGLVCQPHFVALVHARAPKVHDEVRRHLALKISWWRSHSARKNVNTRLIIPWDVKKNCGWQFSSRLALFVGNSSVFVNLGLT